MMRVGAVVLLVISLLSSGPVVWAISWETDLAKGFEKAASEGKPVVADFYTDWCGWCKKLDKDVYEDADVNAMSDQFIWVKINCETDKETAAKYEVRAYPTIIFFDARGKVKETMRGYGNARVFMGFLRKVLDSDPAVPAAPIAIPRPQPVHEMPVVKNGRAPGEFELDGIMSGKAIVNDKVVVVGDEVDSAKVVEISSDRVKLRYKDQDIKLTIT